MAIGVILAVCALLVLLMHSGRKSRVLVVTAKPTVVYGSTPWAEPNQEIERWVKANFDKRYWGAVAGTNHLNDDGTSRQKALAECRPRDVLSLIPEPSNPRDRNAVKVLRENGQQIGYLPRRLAATMQPHLAKGESWHAILSEVTGIEPHPHPWQGANIWLVRQRERASA